jgi:hypothetical protein
MEMSWPWLASQCVEPEVVVMKTASIAVTSANDLWMYQP